LGGGSGRLLRRAALRQADDAAEGGDAAGMGVTMTEQMRKEDKDMRTWEGFGVALTQKEARIGTKERNLAMKQILQVQPGGDADVLPVGGPDGNEGEREHCPDKQQGFRRLAVLLRGG